MYKPFYESVDAEIAWPKSATIVKFLLSCTLSSCFGMCTTVCLSKYIYSRPQELKNQCGEHSFVIEAYTSEALSIQVDAKLVNRVT